MRPPDYNPNWPDDVKALYKHDMREIWDCSIAPHIWNQYHNQLEIYLSLASGMRGLQILDVGCAQGTLALLLAEAGHEVWALDLRQRFLEYAQSRYTHGHVHFVNKNVFDAAFGAVFDVIYANQVLEHVVHPESLIARLAGWLSEGGCLVVSTPNGQYLKNALPSFTSLVDPLQYEGRQFTADADGHFFAYQQHELKEIFESAGLVVAETRFFESPWISGHMKIRYLHRWVPVCFLRFIDRATLRVPGLSRLMAHQLLVVGRKAGGRMQGRDPGARSIS